MLVPPKQTEDYCAGMTSDKKSRKNYNVYVGLTLLLDS